jgi:hypothetical protein
VDRSSETFAYVAFEMQRKVRNGQEKLCPQKSERGSLGRQENRYREEAHRGAWLEKNEEPTVHEVVEGYLMLTNQFVSSRKVRMIVAGIGCALMFAGIATSLHADTDTHTPPALHPSEAVLATNVSCKSGQKKDGTTCVERGSIIHIDAAPAYACMTREGTVGDRRVAGVCADKPELTADSAVNLAVQLSTR